MSHRSHESGCEERWKVTQKEAEHNTSNSSEKTPSTNKLITVRHVPAQQQDRP
ncbi:hypothetical protein CHS0354_025123, partial [Potamilus streckersoni]